MSFHPDDQPSKSERVADWFDDAIDIVLALIILFFIALAFAGCVPKKPETVYIPAECPAPPKIERPILFIPADNAAPDDVAKICIANLSLVEGYSKQLETILSGYKK